MLEQKLEFHEICLSDQEWMNKKLKEDNLGACEYCFANNYLWRKVYHTEAAQLFDCGIIRFHEEGNHIVYSFPFGNGDKKKVLSYLKEQCEKEGRALELYPIVDEDRLELLEWFPGQFEVDADRDDFDYVYTVEKLSTLKGKKLHGKRNHIARFKDADDWSYEPLSDENALECKKMAFQWSKLREEKWNEEMQQELDVLTEALSLWKELHLVGGVLRKAGEIVAFSMGEPLTEDSFVVHFEKAFPDLQGAYPMINQQFVLHACQEYSYVNREEDTGDPGLRKAKLSYYPDVLLHKYRAIQSQVVFANEFDFPAIQEIWQACFGDEEEYIQFYLNHRFETENMLVIHEDGKPVSMASFFQTELVAGEERVPALYVYAVATLPKYQKKGYAAQILEYAKKKYNRPLILQPAEASLEAYYEKLGFESFFEKESMDFEKKSISFEKESIDFEKEDIAFEKENRNFEKENMNFEKENIAFEKENSALERTAVVVDDTETSGKDDYESVLAGWCFKEITPAEYKQIRDAYYGKDSYVCWDEKAIAYAIYENNFCNGKARKLVPAENTEEWVSENTEETEHAREELLLYRIEDGACRIIETTLEMAELRKVANAMIQSGMAAKVFLENAGGMIWLPQEKKHLISLQNPYLNLTLG